MAIALRGVAADLSWFSYTADGTVPIPTALVATDLMILCATWKAFGTTAQITTPAGWTEITEFTDGAVAAGAGTGSMKVGMWAKVATGPVGVETDPTLDWSVSPAPGAAVVIAFSKGADEVWDFSSFTTAAIAAAISWTATGAANINLAAGDVLLGLAGFRDDSALMTRVGTTALGAAGITWSADYVEAPTAHFSTTTSNDMAADLGYRIVASGTSSAAPTADGVLSASETGAFLFLRLRVTTAANYAEVVKADAPYAYWRLGEASGSVGQDETPGNRDATYVDNGVSLPLALGAAGLVNGADTAYGPTKTANHWITVNPVASLLVGSQNWSVEAWVNQPSAVGSYTRYFSARNAADTTNLSLIHANDFFFVNVNGADVVLATALAKPGVHHLVVTFDGTNLRVYADGALHSGPTAATIGATAKTEAMIGGDNGSGITDGSVIDEAAVYGYALSATRVTAHYDVGLIVAGGAIFDPMGMSGFFGV